MMQYSKRIFPDLSYYCFSITYNIYYVLHIHLLYLAIQNDTAVNKKKIKKQVENELEGLFVAKWELITKTSHGYLLSTVVLQSAPGFNTLKKLVDSTNENFMEKVFTLQFFF